MDLLRLIGSRDLAGTDSPGIGLVMTKYGSLECLPDRLVGNNDLSPVLHFVGNGLELCSHDFDRLSRLTLLQTLTTAQNDANSTINSRFSLACNETIVFLKNDSPL